MTIPKRFDELLEEHVASVSAVEPETDELTKNNVVVSSSNKVVNLINELGLTPKEATSEIFTTWE
jgi:hypothetical protein